MYRIGEMEQWLRKSLGKLKMLPLNGSGRFAIIRKRDRKRDGYGRKARKKNRGIAQKTRMDTGEARSAAGRERRCRQQMGNGSFP